MWVVYFLKSTSKRWYYVGSTNDLERRVKQHDLGRVRSTKNHCPFLLVHTLEFGSEAEARAFERRIKKQRLLKEQIIRTIEL
ncbi:GIY-YIG nuclease family protein [Candidatus Kaiserbacteria bacterium]|nr:GIY-YIG nuclease family protein [Candidatus Kaiserbacteria bacterium]